MENAVEKKKILVIEDEFIIRLNLTTLLGALGIYELREAPNGVIGVEVAEVFRPDLIISDVNMPELDGYGVLRALRNNPALHDIPFIFLTALASKQEMRQGMELGADDYLTKPFTKDELYSAVSARLEKHAQQKRVAEHQMETLRQNLSMALPHELLTPLIGMIGCADVLEHNPDILTTDDIAEMGRTVRESAKKLQRVIENFLTLSRLEIACSNPATISEMRKAVSLSASSTAREAVEQQAMSCQRMQDIIFIDNDAPIGISEQHFSKMIAEIVSNALKFSQPGTPVSIEEYTDDDNWNIRITDRGRGMTTEQIENIGAYMQFERKLYEQQGTGLGLAIAKRICMLYGGSFHVDSALSQQTTVTISLPIAAEYIGAI